ncbi:DNA polymerase III subunit beta [Paenibacillus pasadenensis]|uniref:DNA polymerase III subunit beta n=1 Tax=Paenibacillus pasadenensis TaxID=217090 RepID=UPI00204149FA
MLAYVAKQSLMEALQHVLKAVSVHNPIPILTGIQIVANSKGLLFTASNSSMTIQHEIPLGSELNVRKIGSIVVPARYFHEVIRKSQGEIISLELKEHLVLTIIADHSLIRLRGMDSNEFPKVSNGQHPPTIKFEINSALLKSSIKQVAAVASTSEARPILTGVCFNCNHETMILTATDGIRLATRTVSIAQNEIDACATIIIPSKNLYEASKIMDCEDGISEIQISRNQIRFKTSHSLIHSSLIEGTFPSVKNVIPKSCVSEVTMSTSFLLNAVERAVVLADKSIMRLTATSTKLDLLSKTSEIGDVQDEVPIEKLDGEEFTLSLNAKFLMDILRNIDSSYIKVKYASKKSPIIIQPVDDLSTALFLITPVITAD